MELRIAKSSRPDIYGRTGYWVEQMNRNGFWWMVDGTIAYSAGEAWEAYELQQANQEAIVTPEEIAMLLRGQQ